MRPPWTRTARAISCLLYTSELGDALFALVSLARQLDIDPEKALHRATDKFISRFAAMESLAGRDLASLNAAEWRALWQRAKTLTCSE